MKETLGFYRIVQNVIEGFGNNNNATYPPTAVMRIVDVGRGGPAASQIELGDELELQIFVNSLYSKFNFTVA